MEQPWSHPHSPRKGKIPQFEKFSSDFFPQAPPRLGMVLISKTWKEKRGHCPPSTARMSVKGSLKGTRGGWKRAGIVPTLLAGAGEPGLLLLLVQTTGSCLSPTTPAEIGFLPVIALLFTNTNACF